MVWDKKDEKLTEIDREIIGESRRVTIPLAIMESGNKLVLREVATVLRTLAQVIDIQAGMREISEKDALLRVRHEIGHANKLITEATKRYDIILLEGSPTNLSRSKFTKVCDNCEHEFYSRKHHARFCSPKCRQADYRERMMNEDGTDELQKENATQHLAVVTRQ